MALRASTSKGVPMKKFKKPFLKKALSNQKGQGVMEYVIISSLVGIVCIVSVKGFGTVIKNRVDNMKEEITENVKMRPDKKD